MSELLATQEGYFSVYHTSQATHPERHPGVGWYYESMGVAWGPDQFSPCFPSADEALSAAQLHERLEIGCNDVVMCSNFNCMDVVEVEKMVELGWQVTDDGDWNLCPKHRGT